MILLVKGITAGAILLLFSAFILILRWSLDLFSYFTALVYLGGVLILLLYFTSFVQWYTKPSPIYSIIGLFGFNSSYLVWFEGYDILWPILTGPLEVLFLVLVFLLIILSWLRQKISAFRL